MAMTPEQKREARAKLRQLPHVVEAASMAYPMDGWDEFSNCAGMDIDVFFLSKGGGAPLGTDRYAAARAACDGCTVKAHCLLATLMAESAYSSVIGSYSKSGFSGGLSPSDRQFVESFVIGVRGVRDAVPA